MSRKVIQFEGFSADEMLSFSYELDDLIFTGNPLAFQIGSANILGEFNIESSTLIIELAHIEGGGEGVLPALASLAKRFAHRENLIEIEWLVHAVNCAKPNPRLRRVLKSKGFVVEEVEGAGEVYHLIETM